MNFPENYLPGNLAPRHAELNLDRSKEPESCGFVRMAGHQDGDPLQRGVVLLNCCISAPSSERAALADPKLQGRLCELLFTVCTQYRRVDKPLPLPPCLPVQRHDTLTHFTSPFISTGLP